MSKAVPAAENLSIESLLDSIRRAIHDEYTAATPDANARAGAAAPRVSAGRPSASQNPPALTSTVPASAAPKRGAIPAPRLRSGPEDNPRVPWSTPRPFIAPLAPQFDNPRSSGPKLEGSLRNLKVSVQPATPLAEAGTSRADEPVALRSRIADLSATRERLARISAGGPSSFASVLGGYIKPDEALRKGRTAAFEPSLPAPPPVSALRGSGAGAPGIRWEPRRDTSAAAIPTLDLTPASLRKDAIDADEGYIEDSRPDPGASDYAAEAWDRPEDVDLSMADAPPALPAVAGSAAARDRAMLSQDVADATTTAFDRLADTIVSQASGGSRSMENITRDLLRPMLKAWLDTNLQGVVERLVREEIDRVSRRSGR